MFYVDTDIPKYVGNDIILQLLIYMRINLTTLSYSYLYVQLGTSNHVATRSISDSTIR